MYEIIFFQQVQTASNNEILSATLDFWNLKHPQNMEDTAAPASFAFASIEEYKRTAFITAGSSIQNVVDIVQHHSHNYSSKETCIP